MVYQATVAATENPSIKIIIMQLSEIAFICFIYVNLLNNALLSTFLNDRHQQAHVVDYHDEVHAAHDGIR